MVDMGEVLNSVMSVTMDSHLLVGQTEHVFGQEDGQDGLENVYEVRKMNNLWRNYLPKFKIHPNNNNIASSSLKPYFYLITYENYV